jgi:hypothetical protein
MKKKTLQMDQMQQKSWHMYVVCPEKENDVFTLLQSFVHLVNESYLHDICFHSPVAWGMSHRLDHYNLSVPLDVRGAVLLVMHVIC